MEGQTDGRTDYHADGCVFTKGILFLVRKERLIILYFSHTQCLFHRIIKISSDCFPIHQQRVGVCNRDVACSLRGKLYRLFRCISRFNGFTKFLLLIVVSPDLMLHIFLPFIFLFSLLPSASFLFIFLLLSLFVYFVCQ